MGWWHCIISLISIAVQVLENKVSEKEQEHQAEVIQREHVAQEKLEVCAVH